MSDCHDCAGCSGVSVADLPRPAAVRTVALVGPPNSGKTTLFNRLTGLRQKVANFPGVTVEQHSGRVKLDSGRDALLIDLALPLGLSELMVERGSVAVDGVSLTIAALPAPDTIQLSIIEYTRRHTTLGAIKRGDTLHVEADVIAKHVRRLLQPSDIGYRTSDAESRKE